MRVYIAGPYVPRDCSLHAAALVAQRNVDAAIEAFHRLKAIGHEPFVPHLSHYLHIHHSCPTDYAEWWYEYDLTFLKHWAEVIYMVPGWENSKGATMELAFAQQNGVKVLTESEVSEAELPYPCRSCGAYKCKDRGSMLFINSNDICNRFRLIVRSE